MLIEMDIILYLQNGKISKNTNFTENVLDKSCSPEF